MMKSAINMLKIKVDGRLILEKKIEKKKFKSQNIQGIL